MMDLVPENESELQPRIRRPFRAAVVLVLTLAVGGLVAYAVAQGFADARALWGMGVVVLLGLAYAWNGGSLPPSVERATKWTGVRLNAEDDPRNLSPKVYLPVLAVVLLAAALAWYWYGPKGWPLP